MYQSVASRLYRAVAQRASVDSHVLASSEREQIVQEQANIDGVDLEYGLVGAWAVDGLDLEHNIPFGT
jgi:hypothetical protein